ncbi:MAG: hypothetical protein H7138_19935, partial [Myxococcales bacterium]|nr:hypothetical protein [Myxococcales bacterium]
MLGALTLFACGSVQGDRPDAAPSEDAAVAVDAAVADDAGGCVTWRTRGGHVMGDPCALPQNPSWRIGVAGTTYNTDQGTYSAGPAPESALLAVNGLISVRVVSVADFSVAEGASLRVVGKHPLLVISQSTIVVAGTIDVSSARALGLGAGANLPGCQDAVAGQGTA